MITQQFHKISSINVKEVFDHGDFVTRMIEVKTENGELVQITFFADTENALKIEVTL